MNNSKIRWITQTAIFIALLVVLQGATAALNNQIITGSCVNLVLIISTIMCGLPSGLTVAALSPFFAKMFGIGPALLPLVPAIAVGNIVLVLIWGLLPKLLKKPDCIICNVVTAVVAAFLKFLTLNMLIVKFLIPTVLKLPEKQAAVMSVNFGFMQCTTALIAGAIAVLIIPVIRKAIKK
ncbi:MAG: ECF transporter S component [Clostridia bacterium]|nr:ECF transporter S component [Clostridia bacterium]